MINVLKKTKIIATLGPAIEDYEIKKRMVEAGVNLFRVNFSHADYGKVEEQIAHIQKIRQDLNVNIGILADLQGPKLRVGQMRENTVLSPGDKFVLTTTKTLGDNKKAYINYPPLPAEVKTGETILLDDGKIQLKVIDSGSKNEIVTEVIQGGELKSNKGVNLPDSAISVPSVTGKDLKDLAFITGNDFDWVALSFVRKPADIKRLKKILKNEFNSDLPVIAKIEKPEAIKEIKDIIKEADGIMVARGDLGIEIDIEKVPLIQKRIVKMTRKQAKPVIIATQMMESMIDSLIPSRAEVNDVANSVMDGADAVMLSGETSVGKHPVEVVRRMTDIILRVQNAVKYSGKQRYQSKKDPRFISKIICYYSAETGTEINAQAITTLTVSGFSAVQAVMHRPKPFVYAFTRNKKLPNRLTLFWGIYSFYYDRLVGTDETIKDIVKILKENRLVKKDDFVINLTSMPVNEQGMVNTLRITKIKA
jgi:pyruvate kinase